MPRHPVHKVRQKVAPAIGKAQHGGSLRGGTGVGGGLTSVLAGRCSENEDCQEGVKERQCLLQPRSLRQRNSHKSPQLRPKAEGINPLGFITLKITKNFPRSTSVLFMSTYFSVVHN